MEKRMITTDVTEEDLPLEGSLRPQTLDEYIGQEKTKKTLKIYIEAAKQRHDALDHVLFYGPPGLGKTTLSGIIANEMGTHMKVTSGPAIEKPGEMAAILNNLQEGDILFVDEIHRLNRQVEEVLYPAMEDFAIDIMIGKGASARSIRLDLPKFTLVGATTRAGLLSAPLRDRFGVMHHLEFYNHKELQTIVLRSAQVLGVEIDAKGAAEIAKRSRGTPRLANRLLKRVRDFAQVKYDGRITYDVASFALDLLEEMQKEDADSRGITYFTHNKKGEPLKSVTIPVRGEKDRIIGLLCINFYLNTPFSEYISNFVACGLKPQEQYENRKENFSSSSVELLEDMAEEIRREVIEDKDIPTSNRNKEIIQRLYQKGVYNMKDAVVRTAEILGISKNTVYLHLRNLEQE